MGAYRKRVRHRVFFFLVFFFLFFQKIGVGSTPNILKIIPFVIIDECVKRFLLWVRFSTFKRFRTSSLKRGPFIEDTTYVCSLILNHESNALEISYWFTFWFGSCASSIIFSLIMRQSSNSASVVTPSRAASLGVSVEVETNKAKYLRNNSTKTIRMDRWRLVLFSLIFATSPVIVGLAKLNQATEKYFRSTWCEQWRVVIWRWPCLLLPTPNWANQ